MATQEAEAASAILVATAFVERYYLVLYSNPDIIHKFYEDSSTITRPNLSDGEMSSASTMLGIKEKILSLDYHSCKAQIASIDAQESCNKGILVLVTGFLIGEGEVKRSFIQNFFLAKHAKGYFVLNDIFKFGNIVEEEPAAVETADEVTEIEVVETEAKQESAEVPDQKVEVKPSESVAEVVKSSESVVEEDKSSETQAEKVKSPDSAAEKRLFTGGVSSAMALAAVNGKIWRPQGDGNRFIYFTPEKSQPYVLSRFEKKEDADHVFEALDKRRHPSIARPSSVFKIINDEGYYLAWEALGTELTNIPASTFVTSHWISVFYRRLLNVFFSVINYCIKENISWEYSMDNIYVKDGIPFLLGFTRGKRNIDDDCLSLVALIEKINIYCAYNAEENKEMKELLDCLHPQRRKGVSNWWKNIKRLALLVPPSQRISIVCQVVDLIKDYKELHFRSSTLLEMFAYEISVMDHDSRLSQFRLNSVTYENAKKARRNRGQSTQSSKPRQVWVGFEGESPPKIDSALLARKSLAHFHSMRLAANPAINNRETMLELFEKACPKFMTEMMKLSYTFECFSPALKGQIVPVNIDLDALFPPQ